MSLQFSYAVMQIFSAQKPHLIHSDAFEHCKISYDESKKIATIYASS